MPSGQTVNIPAQAINFDYLLHLERETHVFTAGSRSKVIGVGGRIRTLHVHDAHAVLRPGFTPYYPSPTEYIVLHMRRVQSNSYAVLNETVVCVTPSILTAMAFLRRRQSTT